MNESIRTGLGAAAVVGGLILAVAPQAFPNMLTWIWLAAALAAAVAFMLVKFNHKGSKS